MISTEELNEPTRAELFYNLLCRSHNNRISKLVSHPKDISHGARPNGRLHANIYDHIRGRNILENLSGAIREREK